MTNLDKISLALSEWAFNVAKTALPQVRIPANSSIGHLMGLIGSDPASYNIWDELGFLAEPLIETAVTPAVRKMLDGIPDDLLPDLATKYVDAFVARAQEKGSVNLFGLELGPKAFEGLKTILAAKLNE